MTRLVLAAAAAIALLMAPAALACPDCNTKDCPHAKAAAAEKTDKATAGNDCPCHGGKDCKCGPNCKCEHCAKKAAEKKDEKKT